VLFLCECQGLGLGQHSLVLRSARGLAESCELTQQIRKRIPGRIKPEKPR
jgi:hypothetical protein